MASVSNMAGPVVLGFFMGFYLDKFFNTSPLFTLSLVFLGIATGLWSIIKYTHYSQAYTDPDTLKKRLPQKTKKKSDETESKV